MPHKTATLWSILLLLFLPWAAFALDPTSAVKVTTLLRTSDSWDGTAIVYPGGAAEITALWIEIAPGSETGWHSHTVPSVAMLMDGVLEITTREGKTKRVQAGEALAEVINTVHNGRNIGATTAKLVVFYIGSVGLRLTTREP